MQQTCASPNTSLRLSKRPDTFASYHLVGRCTKGFERRGTAEPGSNAIWLIGIGAQPVSEPSQLDWRSVARQRLRAMVPHVAVGGNDKTDLSADRRRRNPPLVG
jgi:hypothetical protein